MYSAVVLESMTSENHSSVTLKSKASKDIDATNPFTDTGANKEVSEIAVDIHARCYSKKAQASNVYSSQLFLEITSNVKPFYSEG